MNLDEFAASANIPQERAEQWLEHVEAAMDRFGIRRPKQQAAFLAQICHESGGLLRVRENMNYSTPELLRKVWPYKFRTVEAARAYVRQPEKLANFVYAGRNGNGDEYSGDGWRYRGGGLIQLTGKYNYRNAEKGLEIPLIDQPELIEQKEHAAASAGWYWHEHNLNHYADLGEIDCISGIINRGDPSKVALHEEERREAYVHALHVLNGAGG